jgi:prepilin-type processing-associated H-X9-DG protein
VITLIAILAGLLFPAFGRAKEAGRATACLSNLHQLGIALQLYVQDNKNRLPVMRDKSVSTTTNDLPGPDQALATCIGNLQALKCPSDKWASDQPKLVPAAEATYFAQTGSSFSWNSLLNNQDADHLSVMGMDFNPHQIPLMFDKEAFHALRGPGKAVNYLYADGHIKNLLTIEGTIKK